jgi:SAM-dependent methyltransferase
MAEASERTAAQRRYFFEPLLALAGGSLQGRRVLDAGCGDGLWSLEALAAGAEAVLGVDEDQAAIEAARRRAEAAGADPQRLRFEHAPVPPPALDGRYDVALCIGLMERSGKPVELFELLLAAGAELVAIDTEVSGAPSSFFELSLAPGEGAGGVALLPSREAVVELAAEFGYDCVPLAHAMGGSAGVADYRSQRRVAFLCASEVSLAELEWEEPPPVTPWWRALIDPSQRGWQAPEAD